MRSDYDMTSRITLCLGLGLSLFAVGCGSGPPPPKMVEVNGQVIYESKPLELGDIFFTPGIGRGGMTTSALIKNGRYSLKAVPGEYVVQITATREVPGKTMPDEFGKPIPMREQYIPEEFNSKSKTKVMVILKKTDPVDFKIP